MLLLTEGYHRQGQMNQEAEGGGGGMVQKRECNRMSSLKTTAGTRNIPGCFVCYRLLSLPFSQEIDAISDHELSP